MKLDNQLRYAVTIINNYRGESPLHHWLKQFFRQNKQMGSNDRKQVAGMVYQFYRLGHSFKELPAEERILTGIFLCNQTDSGILHYHKPAWNDKIGLAPAEKFRFLDAARSPADIFPWEKELSAAIDYKAFCESFLIQPELFLRIRPGDEKSVIQKLQNGSVSYRQVNSTCIALPNATQLETLIAIDRDAVIQDYSSQQIMRFLDPEGEQTTMLKVWDCCAASGGKSILAYDRYPRIELTVSDIRESMLARLKKRFRVAGISNFKAFAADLSTGGITVPPARYDLIIADLPCTGSGTWGRTPESLFFFDEKAIAGYSSLQKKIISTVIPALKKGGSLLYSTCSVFRKENEEIAAFVEQNFGLKQEKAELLNGYVNKADSMFVSRFRG